jgi:peptidoglycan-N-acetylglucosamine deacetylase
MISTEAPFGAQRGAVSLTFDDGTESQLDLAIPALNARQLRGTFYLTPNGSDWEERLAPWRAVAAAGHEIGNHSLSHICPGYLSGEQGGLEDMTLEQIESDILAAQERLMQIAPHQQQWTFCYPCYATFVGRGASLTSYIPLIAKHFLAGRGGGEYGFANNPARIDLACIASIPTERMSGFEMIGLVEQLTYEGRWVVLVFHEINGSRLTVGSYEFDMLLDYLQRKAGEIWTAPVVEVAARIAANQAG